MVCKRVGLSVAVLAVSLLFVSTESAQAQSRVDRAYTRLIDSIVSHYEKGTQHLCSSAARAVSAAARHNPSAASRLASHYIGISSRSATIAITGVQRIGSHWLRHSPNSSTTIDAAVLAAETRITAARDACIAAIQAAATTP